MRNVTRGGQHLVRAGANAYVFSEVDPANHAGGIHQELCRTRNIAAFRAGGLVQQIVTANHLCFFVGKKWKSVMRLCRQAPRGLRRVHADRHGMNTRCCKFGQVLLYAS